MLLMLSMRLAATVHAFTRARLPTNILIRYLRTRGGPKWAIPLALILVPTYLFAAAVATAMIDDGGPGWLNLVALTCIWNTIKFAWMGLASPVLCVRHRLGRGSTRSSQASWS